MKRLELPHEIADYLCPINGLCDIYEWKTGNRIPDQLLFSSKLGFQLISQKRADSPKMVFWGNCSIGKREYEYWKNIIGYEIISAGGKCFRTTLNEVKALLDRDIPTILFGLDMYFLPYQEKFYHTMHIPGHVVLMVGYDETQVYVHDNSKTGVQTIPIEELRQAWANDYLGISKKNTYFGIDMKAPEKDISYIMQKGINISAQTYLEPPLGFMGKRGLSKFVKEFPTWKNNLEKEKLSNIYLHFIEYSGSTLPELPAKISGYDSGVINPHQAQRDKFADALERYADTIGTSKWKEAAPFFRESGEIIEDIVNGFTEDVINQSFEEAAKYVWRFEKIKENEEHGFRKLLS